MKTRNRSFLIALLVICQTACLGFGVIWATGWLWNKFEDVVYDYVVAEGRAVAHGIALKTSTLKLEDVAPGTSEWEQLQEMCETEAIPHNGFLCFMRQDNGAMLCHPKLWQDPGLLRLFPGRGLLINDAGATPIVEVTRADDELQSAVTGKVDLDGDVYVFTGFAFPDSNITLGVYQSDMAIDLFIASTIRPVMQVGYVLVAFVVGGTSIVTMFLINRYENGLKEVNSHLETQVQDRTRALLKTRNAVTVGLARLAESRDKDTGEHLERLRSYVTVLASELAKTNPEIDHHFVADLSVAATLHDIGKVGIPDEVLLKEGKLTPTERQAMEMHTTLGSECLSVVRRQLGDDDFLEMSQQIAASHHERWDGCGYPEGLRGKEIPLPARLVSLADVYDALTSERPYKEAVSHEEARDWIVTRYGEHFDPAIVEAFVAREADFRRIFEENQKKLAATQEATQPMKVAPLGPIEERAICDAPQV